MNINIVVIIKGSTLYYIPSAGLQMIKCGDCLFRY